MSLVFDSGLSLYRKTLKRIRPVHVALHWISTRFIIPIMERRKGFRTMPDDPFWFRLELLTDRHEAETLVQVDQRIQPGMTVLDIGAHVGYYARRFSRLVGQSGTVISFEPHPRTFAVLESNVGKLGNVQAEQVAVADQAGTAELYDYLMMSASGSLHYDENLRDLQKAHVKEGDVAPRLAQDMPVQTFTVQTVVVDDLLAGRGITRIDAVKMDIEGAEMSALRGMKRIIRQSPGMVLIMEYNPQALSASGDPVAAVAEVLSLGFRRVSIIEKDGALTDLTGHDATLRARTDQLMKHMDVVNLLFE